MAERIKITREQIPQATYVDRGAVNRRKTHCPQGHAYSGDNPYVTTQYRRICKTCRRRHQRSHRARQKAERQRAAQRASERLESLKNFHP